MDRYGQDFADDRASFRLRRQRQLERDRMIVSPGTRRLFFFVSLLVLPFAFAFFVALIVALGAAALGADLGHGEIEICKVPDFLNVDYGRPLSIPTNFLFKDYGDDDSGYHYGAEWPLLIQTLQPAIFHRAQACTRVFAKIADESKVRAVRVRDHRHLEVAGPLDENDPLPDIFPWGNSPPLVAHVISDFK